MGKIKTYNQFKESLVIDLSFQGIEDLKKQTVDFIKEEKSKEWIIYGADKEGGYYNNYPGYLLYLFNRSSKHNAFINGKVLYICGAGVGFDSTDLSMYLA